MEYVLHGSITNSFNNNSSEVSQKGHMAVTGVESGGKTSVVIIFKELRTQ